jgi:hypothetical protein
LLRKARPTVRVGIVRSATELLTNVAFNGCDVTKIASLTGGTAAVSGAMKAIAKTAEVKLDPTTKQFAKGLLRDFKTQVSPLISAYLGMKLESVHVWQVRRALKQNKNR